MTYTNVFTNLPVIPTSVNFLAYDLTESITLAWANSYLQTSNITASIMNVTADAGGYSITLPPADQTGEGQTLIIRNKGANTFQVLKNDGSSIQSIAAGEVWYIYLTDNSTVAGTWDSYQYGTGTSSADAAALAGAGLIALAGLLDLNFEGDTVLVNTTITSADRALTKIWKAGAGVLTLDATTKTNGFFIGITNQSAVGGQVTVVPPVGSTLDGEASLVFDPLDSAFVLCDGTDYYSMGYGRDTFYQVGVNEKDVSGNTDIYLTDDEAQRLYQHYTGTLTGNIVVYAPTVPLQYIVYNDTSGAFTLTFAVDGGSGTFVVPQGETQQYITDGSELLLVPSVAPAGNITFPDGTQAQPGIRFTNASSTGTWLSQVSPPIMSESVNNTKVWSWSSSNSQSFVPIYNAVGSAAAPTYSFTGATTTGEYYDSGTSSLKWSIAAAAKLSLSATTLQTLVDIRVDPVGTGAGDTGQIQFRELVANGTSAVTFKAPDALATDNDYILPSAYPSSDNSILSSSTSGTQSWKTISLNVVTYTSTPGSPYTPPANALFIKVYMIGGGGAGGGAAAAAGTSVAAGGGGGAGALYEEEITNSSFAASYAIVVGAGGTPGAAGNNAGGNGGASSFGASIAAGGSGGAGSATTTNQNAALGGAGGGNGANGGYGLAITQGMSVLGVSGAGASTQFSGGAESVVISSATESAGNNASANTGAGGSGAVSAGTAVAGGSGGSGYVLIIEYLLS